MNTHLKCPHCPRVFSGPKGNRFTMPRLMGSLVIHIKSAHPEHYVPSDSAKNRAAEKTFKSGQTASVPPLYDNIGLNPKPKRVYQPRTAVNAVQIIEVKFCPECGCNLRIIQEAIKMGRGQ